MILDFDYEASTKQGLVKWRIKTAESLPELLAVLNLRHRVYCGEAGYTRHEDLIKRPTYAQLMDVLGGEGIDPYDGEYEVDEHDRIDDIIGQTYDGGQDERLTHIILALREEETGELSLEGRRYAVAGTERYVLDDHGFRLFEDSRRIGLPMEPDVDIGDFRRKKMLEGKLLGENGRLVKRPKEPSAFINAMHRVVVHYALDNGVNASANMITSPGHLIKYYKGLGYKQVGKPFRYHKLGGDEWVAMHIDLRRAKRLLGLAFNPVTRPLMRLAFPRLEDAVYSTRPLREERSMRKGITRACLITR